jgi:transcription elongation factor Elf1
MHTSQYATKLRCQHCGKSHGTNEWPLNGDRAAIYYQTEPGRYNLKVNCPYCNQDWYVVWDDNPGPILPLS